MKLIEIETVVNDICELMGDMGRKKYASVLKSVARKLSYLSFFKEMPYYQSKTLEVSSINTVTLPDDCIKPVKVGLCLNGVIEYFFFNSDICNPSETMCSCSNSNSITNNNNVTNSIDFSNGSCSFCTFQNYKCNDNSQQFFELYSVRPKASKVGTFKFDLPNNRIVFGKDAMVQQGDEVVVMYKSSIHTQKGVSYIPSELFEYIKYAVMEELGEVNLKGYNRQQAHIEERKLTRAYNRLTLEEWEAIISGYKYSAPKR